MDTHLFLLIAVNCNFGTKKHRFVSFYELPVQLLIFGTLTYIFMCMTRNAVAIVLKENNY